MGDFYRLVDRSPALQARARLMADQAAAHLTDTIAEELRIAAQDIRAVAAAGVLTTLRNALLDQARRESLQGDAVETIARRLRRATNQAYELLESSNIASLGIRDPNNRCH